VAFITKIGNIIILLHVLKLNNLYYMLIVATDIFCLSYVNFMQTLCILTEFSCFTICVSVSEQNRISICYNTLTILHLNSARHKNITLPL